MAQINYRFRFSPRSPKQKSGTLANVKIELWAGNMCVVATTGWQLRAPKNQGEDPWLAGPQYVVGRDTPNQNYVSYILFWPKREEGDDTQTQYFDLRTRVVAEYNAWVAQGCPAPVRRGGGGAYQPSNPTQQDAASAVPTAGASLAPQIPQTPTAPQLPAGWETGVDTQANPPKRWYKDPQGQYYQEGDPQLAALLNPQPVAAGPTPNNPFAQPGGQGGWKPPPGGPSLG